MRTRLVAAVLIILLGLSLIPFTKDVQALQATIVIDIAKSEVTAHPRDINDEVRLNLSGTVTCDVSGLGGSMQSVVLTLSVWVDTNWNYNLHPTSMSFDVQTTQRSFTLTVTVPRGTHSDTKANVTVNGEAVIMPGSTPVPVVPDYVDVRIARYFGFHLGLTESTMDIESGETKSNFVDIWNKGNDADLFRVDLLEDRAGPEAEGIEFYLPNPDIRLFMRESGSVELQVRAPDEIDSEAVFDVTIRVTSTSSEAAGDILYEEIRFQLRLLEHDLAGDVLDNSCRIVVGLSIAGLLVAVVAVIAAIYRLRKKGDD